MTKQEVMEMMEQVNKGNAGEVVQLAHDLEEHGVISDAYDYIENIVSTDSLDDMVAHELESGWERVAIFLSGITYMNDDYYFMDGYGNMEDITPNILECLYDDMMTAVEQWDGE